MKHAQHLLIAFFLVATVGAKAQVGIGTTPATSAQLDVSSSSKGLLPPRMTQSQRNAITNPVAGMMIWCSNCVAPAGEMQVFNGINWTNMVGGTSASGTVTICTQEWAVKNLDVDRYRNGDPIPKVTDNATWGALTTGAYCYYNNDSATYAAIYGKLYNWYAVNDPRGLAPAGWHVPSLAETSTVETCLGSTAGGMMKETGTSNWLTPNTGATNSSGFTAVPGGERFYNGSFFSSIGSQCTLWTTTDLLSIYAWTRILHKSNATFASSNYAFKTAGYSVRCLKD